MSKDYKYTAFISYRQLQPDSQVAKVLHRALENYRVPHTLVKQGFPRRLGRMFRDREELAASTNLGETIHEALENSRFLLVVCSTKTPKSKWIRKEVLDFIEMGREDRIFTLLIDGEPQESFPIPLLKRHSATDLFTEALEPLAADIRADSLRESIRILKTEKLRIIAAMIGRSYDELKQRERERTIKRLTLISVASILLSAVFAFLALYAFHQKSEANRRRMISLEQSLSALALREKQSLKNDERAALLARQAHLFSKRHSGSRLDQIDLALRQVLESPRFCVSLKASDSGNSAIAFSRSNNLLAVAGSDTTIRIWNLNRSEEPPVVIQSCPGRVRALSFNSINDRLFAITAGGELLAWSLNPSNTIQTLIFERQLTEGRVTAANFSIDGSKLVTCHVDGFFLIWDLLKPDIPSKKLSFDNDESEISSLSIHPIKNDILITGDESGAVKIWKLHQSASLLRELGRHDSPVSSIAISSDGGLIASGSISDYEGDTWKLLAFEGSENLDVELIKGDVRIWDYEKFSKPIVLDRIVGTVSSLVFSPSGNRLAFGNTGNGSVNLYNLVGDKIESVILPSLEAGEFSISFNRDNDMLSAVTNRDPLVRIWNLSQPAGMPIQLIGDSEAVVSLEFSHSGNQLVTAGGKDGIVQLWQFDVLPHKTKKIRTLGPFRGGVFAVAFGPDDWTVASGSGNWRPDTEPDNSLRIWNLKSSLKPIELRDYNSPVTSIVSSSDGRLIASSGANDKKILIRDIGDSNCQIEPIDTYPNRVLTLAFSPISDTLAWSGSEGILRLENLDTKKSVLFQNDNKQITCIAFDAKGKVIAAGSEDSSIQIWKVSSPKKLLKKLWGDNIKVNDIAINDDLILASANSDGTVKLWDLKETGNYPRVINGPWTEAFSLAFTSNGRWLAVGGNNPKILVYPITEELSNKVCQNVMRNLTSKEWQDFIGDDIDYECTCTNLPPGYDTKIKVRSITK